MGFFNNLFNSASESKDEKVLPWIALNQKDQLEVIVEKSKTKTQFIFKHSTRCGISRMVMNQFVTTYEVEANADLYYLDLLSYRDISNEVSNTFQVHHQSPQLVIVRNGIAVAHASHGAINDMDLKQFV